MKRTLLAMIACLMVGAAGMWVASNFRVKFEAVGGAEPPPPAPAPAPAPKPAPAVAEAAPPEKLPAHLLPPPPPTVQQATGTLPLAVAAGVAPLALGDPEKVSGEVLEVSEAIGTQKLNWGKPSASLRLMTDKPTLVLSEFKEADAEWKVSVAGKPHDLVPPDVKPNNTTGTVTLDLSKLPGQTADYQPGKPLEVKVVRKNMAKEVTSTVTLVRPITADTAARFTLVNVGVTKSLPLDPVGQNLTLVNEYVRFNGFGRGTFSGVQFYTVVGEKPAAVSQATRVKTEGSQEVWEYEVLTRPYAAGDKARVLAVADFGGAEHFAFLVPGDFTFSQRIDAPPKPTLALRNTPVADKPLGEVKSDTTGLPTVRTNARKLTATVTADAQAVALYVEKTLVGVKRVDGQKKAEFADIELGDGREHAFTAEAIVGGAVGKPTVVVAQVVSTPPGVVEVVAPGFGKSNGADTGEDIRIKFDTANPLDAGTVTTTSVGVFHKEGPNPDKSLVTRLPAFDPLTNTLTVHVDKVVPGSYFVRVLATVKDVYGNVVGGGVKVRGEWGYESTLTTSGGTGTGGVAEPPLPSRTAGVTLKTGENVEFPEYTRPRELENGFNPSDRVETRVVRLYYTRDAHRVAQIINRDVKSFNVAAVDVRRRAADRVRDDANLTQDERQQLERQAVQAAGAARAAEAELRQFETQLATARQEGVTARTQLTQREQQLTDARRELTRTEGGTDLRANDLILAQQDRVADIQTAIGRVQTLRAGLQANDPRIDEYRRREDELKVDERDAVRELDKLKKDAVTRADRGNDAQRRGVRELEDEVAKLKQVQAASTAAETALQGRITDARAKVQGKRTEEVRANELALSKDREELRLRQEEFRREVAAAKADPDTYAAGKPTSVDPVRQCSVSVIGEGLVQIRGPVKGLNIIRTMINQIDAPTGQVRVGVHTFQVNGEKVERMDRVSANIQRYLDHSRFLTTQSAQMLRKAVTLVASRRAEEAAHTVAPGCSKAEQELKYLHCFFGKDFIDELRQLDSEFLRSGNKLISLHSMDSTSLSAALFLLALAKNDVRHEILAEWQAQLQTKLPEAELAFYTSGLVCADKCEAHCDKKFCVLAQNAKFASFLGFFDAEVQGADTLTPVQREFVRLAQIFKTRLVTEMELKQRVMERTLLEERMGNYLEELRAAKAREDEAKVELIEFQNSLQEAIVKVSAAFDELTASVEDVEREFAVNETALARMIALFEQGKADVPLTAVANTLEVRGQVQELPDRLTAKENQEKKFKLEGKYAWIVGSLERTSSYLQQFYYLSDDNYEAYQEVLATLEKIVKEKVVTQDQAKTLRPRVEKMLTLIRGEAAAARKAVTDISSELRKPRPDLSAVLTKYVRFRDDILSKLRNGKALKKTAEALFNDRVGPAFKTLQDAFVKQQAADRRAKLARRPLDEKKLLDMLVDEMEDKYIELLDGTRAHTANVDNYLKALATALDDDFQTQFYQPAMRRIRAVAAVRDVQLGQIESTTVLTNNRAFGKVSPAASMEFDLPRRDIALKEAFKGAKAAVQDYGALLNDPVFLSLVKAYGGMPPSATFGGAGGGLPAVRNVLPGLPGSADELLMSQAGSPRREFGTNLEALIPDPAVYKFETGTGYEIRPVISPDGQAVVFTFDYMYTTDVREPVRADEKHLGRVKRHFVHTDVQLSNFELREVSKYWVTLKAARTARGVPLFEDIPGVGALFRPPPSDSSSLQQNLIYSQAAIFPTLFDLMGLRYAPAVADIDPEFTKNDEFVVRGRRDYLRQYIFDYGASRVDDALRIMYGERRPDLYRSQHTIPWVHPNGYQGPGLRQRDAILEEGYDPLRAYPPTKFAPGMHAPLQPDHDPAYPNRPLTLPGGGHVGWDGFKTPSPPPLLARPPGGVPTTKEYTGQHLGTTVTPEPGPRPPTAPLPVPRAYTPTPSPDPKRTGTVPTVIPPPPERPLPTPAVPPRSAPVEPLPLSPRPGATGSANPYFPR